MLRKVIKILKVDSTSVLGHRRHLSQTSVAFKKYKFAINKQNQRQSVGSKQLSGKKQAYGDSTLTYFSLDGGDSEVIDSYNPKQKVYSEIVKDSVQDLLASNEIASELKDCNIDIVEVEISATLSTAYIVWRLAKYDDANIKAFPKEKVKKLLNEHTGHLRALLPAYTSLANVPNIHFVYDTSSERQEEIDKLLDTVKQEIKEFEHS